MHDAVVQVRQTTDQNEAMRAAVLDQRKIHSYPQMLDYARWRRSKGESLSIGTLALRWDRPLK